MTVTTFSELELDESLLEALQDKGFTRPTAIQAAAIPPALDGRDVLGSAPTGTGKTAAYLLPALQHLLDFPRKKSGPPRILILTPTRELAMQVADHARELTKHTHLDIATITGGVAYMNHAEVFSENQDIVVATTGRLLQYIKEENFDCRAVETLILDEADRMLDMGFAQDIEHIAGETRWRKQTLLFSATLEGDAIQDFAERLLEDPVEVSANPSTRERKKIHQWYYRADDLEHKTALLVHLLKQPEATRSIVFVRKRERVHELANWLREAGINNCYLEGEMVQGKRNEAIKRLTEGRVNVLVATDVAALIDEHHYSEEEQSIVKQADALCAYLKCLEELSAGNNEFLLAKGRLEKTLASRRSAEMDYFMQVFVPSFQLSLDEISQDSPL